MVDGKLVLTGGFIEVRMLRSSTSRTSERRKCLSDGYKMHHTSLGGRCLEAEAINAAAPEGDQSNNLQAVTALNVPCLIQILG